MDLREHLSDLLSGKEKRKVDCIMEILVRIFCMIIGYCFGLIQTAYIYGKLHGIDIREHGSGNSGTTNALRVLGKKAGLVVFLGDLLKATAACVLARIIGTVFFPEIVYPMILWTGLGVVVGHNFPFFMHFQGKALPPQQELFLVCWIGELLYCVWRYLFYVWQLPGM